MDHLFSKMETDAPKKHLNVSNCLTECLVLQVDDVTFLLHKAALEQYISTPCLSPLSAVIMSDRFQASSA